MTRRPCPQPSLSVYFDLPGLASRVVHGVRHMHALDLAVRALVALFCLGTAAWMIQRGEVAWPLFIGVLGSLSIAVDAVEFYAVGAVRKARATPARTDRETAYVALSPEQQKAWL